jgi:hypothetical protein
MTTSNVLCFDQTRNNLRLYGSIPIASHLLRMTIALGCFSIVWLAMQGQVLQAQEVWEYSPYRVKFWMSLSPKLALSEASQAEIERKVAETADLHFGATWNVSVEQTPEAIFGSVLHRLDELSVDQLLARELILVIGKSEEAKQAFLAKNAASPAVTSPTEKTAVSSSSTEKENAERDARAASLQSIRTIESAIARIDHIAISPLQFAALQRDIVPYRDASPWKQLHEIVRPFSGNTSELLQKLQTGEITAALVQRIELETYKKVARQIPTRLPWQPESLLKSNDKIYLVAVEKRGECIRVQVKELDAFVRRVSRTLSTDVTDVRDVPIAVAKLARDCFSPLVRIEENDYKTALMRIRGAGLVTTERHPILFEPGDVVLPVIRRDDSNGNPTVLQAIPFTYIAVTERIDPVSKLYGAIFTASRGSLAAAKNRRTQRVGLKVTPQTQMTELALGIQGTTDGAFRGAEVYQRIPGTESLEMMGRTDWRGKLALSTQECPTIQYDPPEESKSPAIAKARSLLISSVPPPVYRERETKTMPSAPPATSSIEEAKTSKGDKQGDEDSGEATPGSTEKKSSEQPAEGGVSEIGEAGKATSDTKPTESKEAEASKGTGKPVAEKAAAKRYGEVALKVPLYLYYIKNGETLLARLPIVTGFQETETASLPDDRRRLEAEAFLKGLQGEVLDVVVRRKILESRIKQKLAAGAVEEADRLLGELKRVKSYEKMSEQIEGIQRRALSTDRGPISASMVARIDRMVEATRQLMQTHLKDNLIPDLEVAIKQAK